MLSTRIFTGLVGSFFVLALTPFSVLAQDMDQTRTESYMEDSSIEDIDNDYDSHGDYDCEARLENDVLRLANKYPDLSQDDFYSYSTKSINGKYHRIYDNLDALTDAQKVEFSYKKCLSEE